MTKPMRWSLILLSLLSLVVGTGAARAQDGFLVDLDVSCEDIELRSLVRSFFSRSLRSLGDVRVAETGTPDYRVAVIAREQGRRWVMSVVIGQQLGTADLPAADGDSDQSLGTSLTGYLKTVEHWLGTGSGPDRLDEEISRLVRSFDKDVLDGRRADS